MQNLLDIDVESAKIFEAFEAQSVISKAGARKLANNMMLQHIFLRGLVSKRLPRLVAFQKTSERS